MGKRYQPCAEWANLQSHPSTGKKLQQQQVHHTQPPVFDITSTDHNTVKWRTAA